MVAIEPQKGDSAILRISDTREVAEGSHIYNFSYLNAHGFQSARKSRAILGDSQHIKSSIFKAYLMLNAMLHFHVTFQATI